MSKEKYRIVTVQEGSTTTDEEMFSSVGATVNHMVEHEKKKLKES